MCKAVSAATRTADAAAGPCASPFLCCVLLLLLLLLALLLLLLLGLQLLAQLLLPPLLGVVSCALGLLVGPFAALLGIAGLARSLAHG